MMRSKPRLLSKPFLAWTVATGSIGALAIGLITSVNLFQHTCPKPVASSHVDERELSANRENLIRLAEQGKALDSITQKLSEAKAELGASEEREAGLRKLVALRERAIREPPKQLPASDHKKAAGVTHSGKPSGERAVRIFFGSDRNLVGVNTLFGDEPADVLHYGYCDVSLPPSHIIGEIEAPSIWRLWREDSKSDVVLAATGLLSRSAFYNDLASRMNLDASKTSLLFVHGFNVSFADAAKRTAQIAYDLGFRGAPVFYSWPSRASLWAYSPDETTVEWEYTHFKAFLEDFLSTSHSERTYIIGHSMGTRVLTRVLADIARSHPELMQRVTGIILAAPDIDARVFTQQIAPSLLTARRPITIYASEFDLAMRASRFFHGGWQRLGDTVPQVTVVDGMDTIDVSSVSDDILGHSVFAEGRSVLADIYDLIHNGKPAKDRFGLLAVESTGGKYWRFRR
jgi:esterase/lipase superfamily enzyme